MSLSAYPFCQGDRAEIGRSRMPMASRRRMKAPPYAPSRSRIAITNNVSWRFAPTTSFGQLTGNPFSTRVRSHAEPQNFPPRMLQDKKPIQEPKRNRGNNKQVYRGDGISMIAKEGLPTLRW